MATSTRDSDRTTPEHFVRVDLLVAAGLVAVTVVGRLLWQAADAGVFDTFGIR